MDTTRAHEIGTMGGCGLVALAVIKRRGGNPMLRYDEDGNATHAAVMLDGELIHWGDNEEHLTPVELAELHRACLDDFDPARVCLEAGDIKRVVKIMGLWNT